MKEPLRVHIDGGARGNPGPAGFGVHVADAGGETVAELYAPAAGEVVEVNLTLEDKAEQINSDPYVAGWMIKLRCHDPDELGQLLSAQDYSDLIADL